jgi:hypothetical protein
MLGIAKAQEEVPHSMVNRSVATLTAMGRVPGIVREHRASTKHYGRCPFFKLRTDSEETRSIPCPFEGMHGIYRTCAEDLVHIRAIAR